MPAKMLHVVRWSASATNLSLPPLHRQTRRGFGVVKRSGEFPTQPEREVVVYMRPPRHPPAVLRTPAWVRLFSMGVRHDRPTPTVLHFRGFHGRRLEPGEHRGCVCNRAPS